MNTYQCDECKEIFSEDKVLLDPAVNNLILTGMDLIFRDGEGKIRRGSPDGDKGDMMFACPHCKRIHIFGFNMVQNEEK